MLGETVLGAERLGDRLGDERGVAERGEPDPEDARLVLGHEGRSSLEREPRLAGATRAGERHQASAALDPGETSSSSASLPTKELAGRGRFVFEIVLSGGKVPSPSWKIETGSVDVLEAVLAEVGELERLGSSSATVDGESTTCPPCAALMIRAARCTSMPTYLGGSRAGSPVWRPTRMRIGPASSPTIASLTADTAACAEANA